MRILRAPAAVETDQSDLSHSPGSITKAWLKDTNALFNPPPAPPAEPPKPKEPDGQTDTGERRVPEQPPKPAVGGDPAAAAKPVPEVKPDPAKTPEVKPEPKVDDWETAPAPKGIPAKDFEAWKKGRKESETKLKAEIKAREDKLAEAEAKLTELQGKAQTNGELSPDIKFKLEAQEKEISELRTALMEVDVERDTRWKTHFGERKKAILDRAKQLAGPERAAEIEKILQLKDEEYRAARIDQFLLETDSDFAKSQLHIQLDKLADLDADYSAELKKVQVHNDARAAEKQARSEQVKLEQIKSFNATAQELADPEKGFAPYQKRADDPAWNAAVDQRIALVKSLLTGENNIKPEAIIRGAFDAAAMPVILQSYKASLMQWQSEKEALEKQIQAFTAAQPGPGGGVTENADPDKLTITPDMDPTAINKAFARKAANMARGG